MATYVKPSVVKCETGETDDDLIQRWISWASAIIETEVGQELLLHEVHEYVSGSGTTEIVLGERWVNDVTEVIVSPDGFFGEVTDGFVTEKLVDGVDYGLRRQYKNRPCKSGILVRCNGIWPARKARKNGDILPGTIDGQGNISVKYTAGFAAADIPVEIEKACLDLVSVLRLTRGTGGELSSFSIEGFSQSLGSGASKDSMAALTSAKGILARYARWVV